MYFKFVLNIFLNASTIQIVNFITVEQATHCIVLLKDVIVEVCLHFKEMYIMILNEPEFFRMPRHSKIRIFQVRFEHINVDFRS